MAAILPIKKTVLVIGPQSAGKTTICNQLLHVFQNEFDLIKLVSYSNVVKNNVIAIFKRLCTSEWTAKSEQHTEFAESIIGKSKTSVKLTQEDLDMLKDFWTDAGIQESFKAKKFSYSILESAEYWMSRVDEICKPEYVPSVEDAVRVSVASSGTDVRLMSYSADKSSAIEFVVVPGDEQLIIPEDVVMLIYTFPLTCYNEVYHGDGEERKGSGFEHALDEFEHVMNLQSFAKVQRILVLSKSDVFEELIKVKPLSSAIDGYEGDDSFEDSVRHMASKMLSRLDEWDAGLKCVVVNAADAQNVHKTFAPILASIQ